MLLMLLRLRIGSCSCCSGWEYRCVVVAVVVIVTTTLILADASLKEFGLLAIALSLLVTGTHERVIQRDNERVSYLVLVRRPRGVGDP